MKKFLRFSVVYVLVWVAFIFIGATNGWTDRIQVDPETMLPFDDGSGWLPFILPPIMVWFAILLHVCVEDSE